MSIAASEINEVLGKLVADHSRRGTRGQILKQQPLYIDLSLLLMRSAAWLDSFAHGQGKPQEAKECLEYIRTAMRKRGIG